MPSFLKKFIEINKRILDLSREAANHKLVTLTMNEAHSEVLVGANLQSPLLQSFFAISPNIRAIELLELNLSANMFRDGIKVFRPEKLNCEALENITPSITVAEYSQPFPTMVIELPEEYSSKRVIPNAQAGEDRLTRISYEDTHRPEFVILYHQPKDNLLVAGVYLNSEQCYTRLIWEKFPGENISAALDEARYKFFEGSLPTNKEESATVQRVITLAVNCALLLMEYGCKKIGPENKPLYERLEKNIKKGNKHSDLNKSELAAIPILYDLEQEVTLFRQTTESPSVVPGNTTGKTVKPHWRMGHWRAQHYGPKNSLLKRVLIPAVLVNGHLLQKGQYVNTTYK